GLQGQCQLFGDGLSHLHVAEPLEVGDAFEVEYALDQMLGVSHFREAVLAQALAQTEQAPVLAHLGVDEILVDGGKLDRQDRVYLGDPPFSGFHDRLSSSVQTSSYPLKGDGLASRAELGRPDHRPSMVYQEARSPAGAKLAPAYWPVCKSRYTA